MANAQAASGNVSNIPKDGRLKFRTEFDGKVIISKKDTTIDQYKIISNLVTEIEGITYAERGTDQRKNLSSEENERTFGKHYRGKAFKAVRDLSQLG